MNEKKGRIILKLRFKVNKKFNLLITILACASSIGMMVVRFDYPVEKVFTVLWISMGLLVLLIVLAAPVALLLRWFNSRSDEDLSSTFLDRSQKHDETK